MRLDKTIILVLVSAFIIGAVFFALYEFSDDTLTVAINPEGGVSQTEELNNCERYVFSIVGAADIDLSDEDVSWNINGEWHNEEVAEEPFREQGPQQVKLYVDGKLRADTTVVVGACDVASLIVPSNIVKGETHVLNGTTKNAVGYKWFMNGEVQSDRDGDDSKLTYKFKRSADYEVKVEVTTEDGETKVATRQLQVDEPKKEPVKYAETKPVKKPEPKKEVEKRQENIPIAEPVERYVPPVEEKKEEPVVIEKKPEVVEEKYVPSGQAFGDFDSDDFSKRLPLTYVTKTKGIEFDGAPSFATITEISTDLCLTHVHVLPDPELKSNEIEITIAHSDPTRGKPRRTKKYAQSSGNPYPISVEAIGCGLLKGERYTITVKPVGEFRFGDVGVGDARFVQRGSEYLEVDLGDRTKILGLTFRHD